MNDEWWMLKQSIDRLKQEPGMAVIRSYTKQKSCFNFSSRHKMTKTNNKNKKQNSLFNLSLYIIMNLK